MQKGFPPVIIQSKDKSNYLTALNKADSGDNGAFVIYIGEQLIHSLEMWIKAAKGEDIEEEDDLDKELELIRRKLASKNKERKIKKTNEACYRVLEESILPLIDKLSKDKTLNNFYIDIISKMIIKMISSQHNRDLPYSINLLPFNNYNEVKPKQIDDNIITIKDASITIDLNGFKFSPIELNLAFGLTIKFDAYEYKVIGNVHVIST